MPELRFEDRMIKGADLGEEASVPDLLGEHILQNDLEFHLDEWDEIYEGYGRRKNAYPYRQYKCYVWVICWMRIIIDLMQQMRQCLVKYRNLQRIIGKNICRPDIY